MNTFWYLFLFSKSILRENKILYSIKKSHNNETTDASLIPKRLIPKNKLLWGKDYY